MQSCTPAESLPKAIALYKVEVPSFERAEKAFDHRIVEAVTFSAHALRDFMTL